jgi:hypothetical protein
LVPNLPKIKAKTHSLKFGTWLKISLDELFLLFFRVLASFGAMNGGQKEKEGEGNEEKRKRKRIGGKKLDFAGEMQALVEGGGGSQQKEMKRRKNAAIWMNLTRNLFLLIILPIILLAIFQL